MRALLPFSRQRIIDGIMTTLSIKVPDKLVAQLDHAAKVRRKSRSALVREALIEKAASLSNANALSLLDRTRDVCGAGFSGLGDLSSNPRYFDDFAK